MEVRFSTLGELYRLQKSIEALKAKYEEKPFHPSIATINQARIEALDEALELIRSATARFTENYVESTNG